MASVNEDENQLTVATPTGVTRTYVRTSGAAPEKGKKFEIKMTALMYLRAQQIAECFLLGVNDSSAGGFDDIILKYTKDDSEHELWIQLKYLKRDLNISHSTKNSELFKLYESINKLSKGSISEHFKNTYFVFFTNTNVKLGASSAVEVLDPLVRNLLDTGGRVFQIKFSDKVCACFKKVPDGREFVKRLIICSNQATLNVLDEIIKQEFMNVFSGIPPNYKDFLVEIEDYLGLSDTTPYLTELWEQWNKLKQTFKNENILLSKMLFHQDVLHKVASEILHSEHQITHVKCEGTDTHLRRLKIYQALRNLYHRKIMFVNLPETEYNLQVVKELWSRGYYDVLVVDLDTNSNLSWLEDVIMRHETSKRIVILSSDKCDTSLKFHCISEKFSFIQLENISKDYVLDKEIDFQGKVIKFGSLNAYSNLTGIPLNTLLMNNQLKIGQLLPITNQVYIRRHLSKRILVDRSILVTDSPTEIFYISGVTEEELQVLLAEARGRNKLDKKWHKANSHRFNIVEERKLHKIARDEKFVGKSVHFLEIVSGSVYWIHSVGNTRKVFEFMDTQPQESIDILMKLSGTYNILEDDLVVSGLTRLIITGGPGIGKTFLLSHMSERLKGIYPSHWIIVVNLTAYSNHLNTDKLTFNEVFEILASSAGAKGSVLAEELLKTALDEVGNVCILCDAFDEIGPRYTENVIKILQIICSKKVHILWVTSRQVAVEKLESEMQANIFTVQPFTEEEEFAFFSQHWGKERADKMLSLLYKKFTFDQGIPVSSFPLHMMMIHEVFNKLVLADNFIEISKLLNITDLYERFIARKLQIHYVEKNNMDEKSPTFVESMELLEKEFKKRHFICSLAALNIIEQLEDNTQKDSLMYELEEYKRTMTAGKGNTGIIDGFVNDNPRFIHRTFAEFFAALWLAENKLTSLSFIRTSMFEPWYKELYEVFNRIVAKNCPIHIALLNKNFQECRELLKGDINKKDAGGRTALHLAARYHEKQGLNLVKSLLAGGANMEVCDKLMECTPLYYAVGAKSWGTVRLLLEHGAHVNNSIAIITEVQHFITSLLPTHKYYSTYLKSGFEMYWAVFHNKTAIFHLAVEKGNIPCAKVLLENGMDINARNNNEETPLFRAIITRQIEMIMFLMEHGADSSSVNRHGNSALHVAAKYKNKDTFQCLLHYGAVTNIKNKGGNSLLHLETILKSPETVDILLKQGLDVTDINREGITPLHVCSQRLMLPCVAEMLLAHGASPTVVDRRGNTPLHIAVSDGALEMIALLLDHDTTSLSKVNMSGNTPLHLAVTEDEYNQKSIVELLLKNGAPVLAVDKSGNTPLHIACACGEVDYVKLLLEYGASATHSNDRGDTPLHAVVANGMTAMDTLFLDFERAAAIGSKSTRDLLKHITKQISTIVSVLLEHGATLEQVNKNGSTPLHVAVKSGILPIIKLLLDLGAPAGVKDYEGQRPLDIAVTEGLEDKVEVLLAHEFQMCVANGGSDAPIL